MIGNIFRVLISVRSKLFFGFLTMTIIILLLGGYAVVTMGAAGNSVKATFDRPLMAVNFSRSASQLFSELQIEDLQQSESWAERDSALIADSIEMFREDLSVAKERSIAPRAEEFFNQVETDLKLWESLSALPFSPVTQSEKRRVAGEIAQNLDIIVELQTNQSFRLREATLGEFERFRKFILIAIGFAVVLSLALSAWLAITIINPLKAAAIAARKISAGDFTAHIPRGGDDETGALLKTMAVMQANIRQQMGQEQNLRELAQDRLSDSLKNSKGAILLTNETNEIIVSNPQTQTLFKALAGKDLVGKSYLDYFREDGAPLLGCEHYNAERGEIKLNDGRWAQVSASDTQEGGKLFIWTDITESKIRNANLREAKEAAEAADKAKSHFLAAMSHELRTPLNAVIGFSDIIKNEHQKQGGNANHAKLADLISQSGAHLLGIVKDVLSIAGGKDAQSVPTVFKPVNVTDAIKFTCAAISIDAGKKNVRIIQDFADVDLNIKGDSARLRQAILHLLSNAVKFNDDDGIVKVMSQIESNGVIRIDVIDNGIGIAETDLKRIVEPFTQVETGYKRAYDGAGLGLSLVKKIIEAHDGEMRIRSKLGKGTVVTLLFPPLTASQRGAHKIAV